MTIFYRMMFPLTAIGAVLLVSAGGMRNEAGGTSAPRRVEPAAAPVLMVARSLKTCCETMPSRGSALSKPLYNIKFSGHNVAGVDYDAGGQLIDVTCTFEDLDNERPVVGMSTFGILRRIQTDSGSVMDGSDNFGVISPGIQSFKDAQFQVRAKIPLQTNTVIMLNGALTVMRACERATLTWREPFDTQLNVLKKSCRFEIALTKAERNGDTFVVEWSVKPDPQANIDEELWQRRQLKSSLTFSDKSSAVAEAGTETPYVIRRVFRHNKKFATSVDLSFISDLQLQNLPFTLTNIVLDGSGQKKDATNSGLPF